MKRGIKILVLGAHGMLGYMVVKILADDPHFSVLGTQSQKKGQWLYFNALNGIEPLKKIFSHQQFDYCMNCIGMTKNNIDEDNTVSVAKAIRINALFPHELSSVAAQYGTRVIQISSDGVFSGQNRFYDENSPCDCQDVYGRTKVLGEVNAPNFLNIRCSIIGPSPLKRSGLYEWFRSQPDGAKIKGYTNHIWNGVTTLQFAQLCRTIIRENMFAQMRKTSKVFHFAPNEELSKYELLVLFNKILGKGLTIVRTNDGAKMIKRKLKSRYTVMKKMYPRLIFMELALKEMIKSL